MNEHPVELLNRFSTVLLQIFMAPSKKYLCFAFSFFGFVVGSGGLNNRSPHNVNAKDLKVMN